MLGVKLICVGKLKEAYWRDAVAEYEKLACPPSPPKGRSTLSLRKNGSRSFATLLERSTPCASRGNCWTPRGLPSAWQGPCSPPARRALSLAVPLGFPPR